MYVNCNFVLVKEIKIYNIQKCLYLFIYHFFVKKISLKKRTIVVLKNSEIKSYKKI